MTLRNPLTTLRAVGSLLKAAVSAWIDDYAPSMGAALAYYTLFSIAPLLLIVISVAGLVFGEEAARGQIIGQLGGLLGKDTAAALQEALVALDRPAAGWTGTLVGLLTLLIGATTVFAELQDALDRIWRAPARPPTGPGLGLWRLIRARLLSLGLVLGLGFLLIVSLVVSAALSALGNWWAPFFENWALLGRWVDAAVGFALLTGLFAMIYKGMPRVRIAWRDVWVGAAATALLFSLGKALIATYIGTSGVASPFGAAGSLVVLLIWVYWSAQIFLLGAELTWVYAHRHGSRRGMPLPPPLGAASATPTTSNDAATAQPPSPPPRPPAPSPASA